MTDQRRCIRCERAIDAYARICPYCNWDQSDAAVEAAQPSGGPVYVPPAERSWRKHILIAIGGIVLLIGSFAVGALIHSDEPVPDAPNRVDTQEQTAAPSRALRSDVRLVPVGAEGIDAPITSAPVTNPAEGVPTEYQRSDATAVSSVEYAQLAARADQEKKMKAMVDPRTITGPAYAQAPRPATPVQTETTPPPQISSSSAPFEGNEPENSQPGERARVVVRTKPVPEYQPIPDIAVSETTTARFDLIVGADGRVKSVNIRNAIPGQTAKIISAVQQWRFKPATENGVPVQAPFTVDISFRGND